MEIDQLKFDANGLIPAIVQDAETNEVLMLAYMNADSLRLTLEKSETHFWSRSRAELWHKGKTSGNIQSVIEIRLDCDADSLLIRVKPAGPACHTGEVSCFYRELQRGTTS
jgi:phosphoribosyl-AMP cyclohydrolase